MTAVASLAWPVLENAWVRLEPLVLGHVPALARTAAQDPGIYDLAPVPLNEADMLTYVKRALADQVAGRALPYAIVRRAAGDGATSTDPASTDVVAGSARFMSLEWWAWPAERPPTVPGEPRDPTTGAPPDVAEIGHVWLGASHLRTVVSTATTLLMMGYAFETWGVNRLTLKTDVRNARSRSAIERIGGRFEGVLRAHLPAADGAIRDTAMYSVLPAEWPTIKARLESVVTGAHHGGRR